MTIVSVQNIQEKCPDITILHNITFSRPRCEISSLHSLEPNKNQILCRQGILGLEMSTISKRRETKLRSQPFLYSKRNEPVYSEILKDRSEANSAYCKTLKDRNRTMSAYYDQQCQQYGNRSWQIFYIEAKQTLLISDLVQIEAKRALLPFLHL